MEMLYKNSQHGHKDRAGIHHNTGIQKGVDHSKPEPGE
jgi:hypothetical protein